MRDAAIGIPSTIEGRYNVHIDGCEASVGDGAADGTGESESCIQIGAGRSSRVDVGGHGLGLGGVELARASGGRRRRSRHVAGMDGRSEGSVEWRCVVLKIDRQTDRQTDGDRKPR
jgi:hypothetical protein